MACGNDEVVIKSIRKCKDRKDLDAVFKESGISAPLDKFEVLKKAMFSKEMFFSCGDPTDELKFELAAELFLTMGWKASVLYKDED